MEFSDWLHDQMRERRLSQRHVAWRTGIDHATVSRLLGGGRIPSARTLARLARLFGWPPVDVIDPSIATPEGMPADGDAA